jgi:dipeptidyl aminopeptidase/acylaminoacyl peptidase
VDIVHWAIDRGICTADRIAIWGDSYGGYAALAGLTFAPDVFSCGIDMYGPTDLEGLAGLPFVARHTEVIARLGDVKTQEGRDRLRQQSPLAFAERITKPLLLTHGTRDAMVPREQSDALVEKLQQRRHPVTYLVYADETHDYRSDDSWISFWAVAERFLHKHLGGTYEPFGDEMQRARFTVAAGAEFVPGLEKFARR